MTLKKAWPKQCSVCCATQLREVGEYSFSDWKDLTAANLERVHYRYSIVACSVCQHVMASHTYGEDFITSLYQRPQGVDCWSSDPEFDPLTPYRDMVSFSRDFLPQEGQVVDFGAGNGQILSLLAEEFGIAEERLMGIDFSNYMKNDFSFTAMDLNNLSNKPDVQFDFAYCTHTLEHVFDPRAFLLGVNACAKDDAHLYLEVPDISLSDRPDSIESNIFNPQHLHQFRLENVVHLLENTGWQVLEQEKRVTGFVPRARVIAKKRTLDVSGATASLAMMSSAQQRLRDAIKHLLVHPVALWGVGGDLMNLLHDEPELQQEITRGRLVLFDRDLANKQVYGALIRSSSELAQFSGRIVLTPRPAKTNAPMKNYAQAQGFYEQVIDPYEDEIN